MKQLLRGWHLRSRLSKWCQRLRSKQELRLSLGKKYSQTMPNRVFLQCCISPVIVPSGCLFLSAMKFLIFSVDSDVGFIFLAQAGLFMQGVEASLWSATQSAVHLRWKDVSFDSQDLDGMVWLQIIIDAMHWEDDWCLATVHCCLLQEELLSYSYFEYLEELSRNPQTTLSTDNQ